MRADLALVQAGLCSSRSQARQLIEAGSVFLSMAGNIVAIQKASQAVLMLDQLVVKRREPEFVSRGGIKLFHALGNSQINPKGLCCVDFGQSTGGFTDCLIQHGAAAVVGFDVGHSQLAESLRESTQVRAFEGVNLKDLDPEHWIEQLQALGPSFFPFELAVADLSFISIRRVLPSLLKLLQSGCEALFLVKPQFELGRAHIGKKGLVQDLEHHLPHLKQLIEEALSEHHCILKGFFPCEITGSDGNQEYFIHFNWAGPNVSGPPSN